MKRKRERGRHVTLIICKKDMIRCAITITIAIMIMNMVTMDTILIITMFMVVTEAKLR